MNLMQITYVNQPMDVLDSRTTLNKRYKRCYSNVLFGFVNDLIFLATDGRKFSKDFSLNNEYHVAV